MEILIVILILAALYVLSIHGRTGHPGLAELRKWYYAHRGLHNENRPENSMSAFKAALDKGYGIELDIHLLADGNLAVIHDSSLKRTAGADVIIENLTTEQLKEYHLEGTAETIPEFKQILQLFDGKAPLIVELKSYKSNYYALAEKASEMLADYEGAYCVESFDPRCIWWLKKNRPEIIRGQLSENFMKTGGGGLPAPLRFVLSHLMGNFLTQPDFVAYRFQDRSFVANRLALKLWKLQPASWTLRSQEEFDAAVAEGCLPIFENFEP